jgi:patatin-like phospholipase/acyl hydrolase
VTQRRFVEYFDLITGTSTGGIVAIGLAMGATAEEICRFYETEGATIFPKRDGIQKWLGRVRDVFRPRFSPEALRAAIQVVVGDRSLKEAQTRLVIPTYDVNTDKVYLFKTPHRVGYLHHADLTAVDVALATSAAPAYFPAHAIPGRGTFIDGGLWANCPAMVGLVEAVGFLDQRPEQIRMLSISTTSYPFRLDRPEQLRGLVGWAPKIIDTFMFGQAQAAVNIASSLLRRGVFHRLDYQVPPGPSRWTTRLTPGNLLPWAGRSPN